jgi:ankyrin repeat protein
LEFAKELVKAGSPIDIKDPQGKTPMDWARERGHLDRFRLMYAEKKLGKTCGTQPFSDVRNQSTPQKTNYRYFSSFTYHLENYKKNYNAPRHLSAFCWVQHHGVYHLVHCCTPPCCFTLFGSSSIPSTISFAVSDRYDENAIRSICPPIFFGLWIVSMDI